jgi:leucyl/phenylalanyl-tRNA--protein transferase
MKLVNESKGGWQYLLNQNEADVLRGLVNKFPFTEDVHIHISKTDRDPRADEREKLLNESLAEHRKELKKLAVDLLAGEKWKQSEKGCILTLKSESREILLQILNDIRIGCWRKLGEPEDLDLLVPQTSGKNLAYRNLMELAGYFENSFLDTLSGDQQPGSEPPLLGESNEFPNPELAGAEGPVALGGDLSMQRLLAAYRHGIFPWTVNPITWWSPDPRGIIELDAFHISESLGKILLKQTFEVTFDKAFQEVMQACATPGPKRRSTWITKEFIEAYTELHNQGHAHSVECWKSGELVGGIYGVAVGGLFAGESMFHLADNASKVALYHLVRHLQERQFTLFDIQMVTAATEPLGATAISRGAYLKRLAISVEQDCSF